MKKLDNRGTVIVEATLVFPVVFMVIFILMVFGNAYWQKSKIDQFVMKSALDGAAYCGSPIAQQYVENENKIPGCKNVDVYPYRYFLTGYEKEVAYDVEEDIKDYVDSISTGLFSGMEPKTSKVEAKFNNWVVYSTFSVEVNYKIKLPVRLIGMNDWFYIGFSTRNEVPVSDTGEFMRNIDMAVDYMQQYGVDKKIEELKSKINSGLEKVKELFK